MKALEGFLRPEFINRVDEIITFNSLTEENFEKIAEIMLGKLKSHFADKGIKLVWSEDVLSFIAEKSYSEKYGARNMRRFIRVNVEDRLAEKIIADYSRRISGVALGYSKKENKLTVECI
jgi:ATP-dependent Clp protease ATP-binding subunit ClpA